MHLSGLRRARLPAATPARRPRGGLAASSVDQDRGPRVQGSERLASRARGGLAPPIVHPWSLKIRGGAEGGSMGSQAVGGARAPLAPPVDPPLLIVI